LEYVEREVEVIKVEYGPTLSTEIQCNILYTIFQFQNPGNCCVKYPTIGFPNTCVGCRSYEQCNLVWTSRTVADETHELVSSMKLELIIVWPNNKVDTDMREVTVIKRSHSTTRFNYMIPCIYCFFLGHSSTITPIDSHFGFLCKILNVLGGAEAAPNPKTRKSNITGFPGSENSINRYAKLCS
jgi:hypothetical protein